MRRHNWFHLDVLRTRPSEPLERVAPEIPRQACDCCGQPKARYNGDDLCYACQDKQDDARWSRFYSFAAMNGKRSPKNGPAYITRSFLATEVEMCELPESVVASYPTARDCARRYRDSIRQNALPVVVRQYDDTVELWRDEE